MTERNRLFQAHTQLFAASLKDNLISKIKYKFPRTPF